MSWTVENTEPVEVSPFLRISITTSFFRALDILIRFRFNEILDIFTHVGIR